MAASVQYNSGYLGWSWKGNSTETQALDISTDWAGTQLTPWGEILVNSAVGTKTAVEASVFGGTTTNKMPTATITSPSNNATFQEGEDITIQATAADEDGKVRRVEFYQGSTKIGQDTSAPYSFTWADVAKGTYTFTAFVIDNANGSGISNSVSVLVTGANGNILSNGDFESGSTGWEFQTTAPGTGTMTVATDASMAGQNSLRICPTNPGTEDWHLQAITKSTIVAGQTYQLSFLAKADMARGLKVGFQQHGGKWKWYTGQDFSLGTSSQLYSYSFTADTTDPIMDIKFFVGIAPACVNIDNVIFSSNTATGMGENKTSNTAASQVYPNPFTHRIAIVSSGDFRYEMRNQLGQLMEQGTGKDRVEIGAGAPKGFYILKVIAASQTSEWKVVKE